MDRRCRESEGKAKIEGYMSVSDEEAHHRIIVWLSWRVTQYVDHLICQHLGLILLNVLDPSL